MSILIITQAPRQGTEGYGNELNNYASPGYTGKVGEGGTLERQNDRNSLLYFTSHRATYCRFDLTPCI